MEALDPRIKPKTQPRWMDDFEIVERDDMPKGVIIIRSRSESVVVVNLETGEQTRD